MSYGQSSSVRYVSRARAIRVAASVIACLLGGCSTGDAGPTEEPTLNPRVAKESQDMKEKSVSERPEPLKSLSNPIPHDAMNDLLNTVAGEAGVSVSEIKVLKSEAVTWRDGSLGCPEPGMAYSQALIDGFHIILSANGETYDMRATRTGRFSRCLNPTKPDPLRDGNL